MLLLDINTSCSVIITSSATGQIHTLFLRRQANEELSIYKITYILNNSTEACLTAKTASCTVVLCLMLICLKRKLDCTFKTDDHQLVHLDAAEFLN